MEEKYGIGKKFITNEGYEIEIIEKFKGTKRKVRFDNGHEVITECSVIDNGAIKNPCHISVFGIGYYGVGKYRARTKGKQTLEYKVWQNILGRCFDKKINEKHPTYKNVTVCSEWLNFQTFAKWYHENKPKIDNIVFEIDKDLLQQNTENRVYSPKTCIFLPSAINAFLTNKQLNNTSGYTGVHWAKTHKKWAAQINLFGERKVKHLGLFTTPEEASQSYQQSRSEQAEKLKDYLRSLKYLPEHIIQLIK